MCQNFQKDSIFKTCIRRECLFWFFLKLKLARVKSNFAHFWGLKENEKQILISYFPFVECSMKWKEGLSKFYFTVWYEPYPLVFTDPADACHQLLVIHDDELLVIPADGFLVIPDNELLVIPARELLVIHDDELLVITDEELLVICKGLLVTPDDRLLVIPGDGFSS